MSPTLIPLFAADAMLLLLGAILMRNPDGVAAGVRGRIDPALPRRIDRLNRWAGQPRIVRAWGMAFVTIGLTHLLLTLFLHLSR